MGAVGGRELLSSCFPVSTLRFPELRLTHSTCRGIRAKGPARKVADVEESPLAALGMGNEKVYEDIAAVANACDLDQSCDPRRRSQYIFAGNIICRTIDFGILA